MLLIFRIIVSYARIFPWCKFQLHVLYTLFQLLLSILIWLNSSTYLHIFAAYYDDEVPPPFLAVFSPLFEARTAASSELKLPRWFVRSFSGSLNRKYILKSLKQPRAYLLRLDYRLFYSSYLVHPRAFELGPEARWLSRKAQIADDDAGNEATVAELCVHFQVYFETACTLRQATVVARE
jgi:hypothetical protein